MRTFAEKPKATQQATSRKTTVPTRSYWGHSHEVNSILHLQRRIGNHAVQRLLQSNAEERNTILTDTPSPLFGHDFSRIPIHPPAAGAIQTKLAINTPGDEYEQEADRVADKVMRMPEPKLQRACACGGACPKCKAEQLSQESKRLQTTKRVRASNTEQVAAPPIVHDVLQSPGQPLQPATRAFMETRFGHDFSQVRVHADANASESARAVNALAYTVGRNVVFGAGQYAPGTREGKRLLAHELTHVIQQSVSVTGAQPVIQRRRCTSSDASDSIVGTHTVNPNTIENPGDSVDFSVRFNCEVRGFRSEIEDSRGQSLNLPTYPPQSSFPRASYSRNWDGKRSFSNVGTYMVDDGSYRHRLAQVLYAYRYNGTTGTSDNLYATGVDLQSPNVQVSTRAGAFSNYRSNHYSEANVEVLARIIRSEMGVGNEVEQRAIAWAVRNQMVRLNTRDATVARDHFSDAHGQAPNDDARRLAQEVLSVDMGHDTTSGAIKWFSPQSMPSEGESCSGYDCGGGLITVNDTGGTAHRKFAPTFHLDMRHIAIAGVREWYVRFYKL